MSWIETDEDENLYIVAQRKGADPVILGKKSMTIKFLNNYVAPPPAEESASTQPPKKRKIVSLLEKYDDVQANEIKANFVDKEKFDRILNLFFEKDAALQKVIEKEHQLALGRSQIFRDATSLYKRGIIELLLKTFLNQHYQQNDQFLCKDCHNTDTWFNVNFASVMKHWRLCPLHTTSPEVINYYEEGLYKVDDEKARVIWSIDNLYGNISNMDHIKVGESFPIKVIPMPDKSDTLALLSFLKAYYIPFTVAPNLPVPPIKLNEVNDNLSSK